MSRILSLRQSAEVATKVFRTFVEGKPDLVPTGFEPVDEELGGLFPGTASILAAATGAGKSSLVLHAALNEPKSIGVVSLEDPEDVWGSRALAYYSGVNSLRIRTKSLSAADIARIKTAYELLEEVPLKIAYSIGGQLEEVCDCICALAESGCRHVYVDYIQKMRGSGLDRRNEIGGAFTALQRQADKAKVALTVVSQLSRQVDPTKPPSIYMLKESGDLENEARLILLGWRDPADRRLVSTIVAKSTFGGEGLTMRMRRDDSGTLRLDDEYEVVDEF